MSAVKQFLLERSGASEKAFRLIEIPLPTLAEDCLLIKVQGFGLNFADIMARKGKYREAPPRPFVPGYEMVGIVERVGAQCSEEWLGKRVAGFCRFGGYSSYVMVNPTSIAEVGDWEMGDVLSLCTQGVTSAFMADHIPSSSEGGFALVHSAAGGVGNLLIQMLHQKGIKTIGKIRSEQKVNALASLPVDHILVSNNDDYHDQIKELVGNTGLVAAFNPLGGRTIKRDLDMLNPGGQLFLYGGASLLEGRLGMLSLLQFVWKSGLISPIPLMMGSKTITGINVLKLADSNPVALKNYLMRCIEAYQNQQLRPLSATLFNHKDFHEAQNLLESGQSAGKIAVYWDDL